MFTNEILSTKQFLHSINNDFDKMLCRSHIENQAILSRIACEISNSFTLINSQLQLLSAHHPQLNELDHWDQLSLDANDITKFLHDFSFYIHSEQLNIDEINLAKLFTEIVDTATERTIAKEIELKLTIGEPLFICLTNYLCDSVKLKLAITNSINWLIDITDNNHTIHITLPSSEDDFYLHSNGTKYMKIQLTADISPLDTDILECVYQPVSDNKCISTNLSMSIAHRIIYAHKGGMSLDSTDDLINLNIFLPL